MNTRDCFLVVWDLQIFDGNTHYCFTQIINLPQSLWSCPWMCYLLATMGKDAVTVLVSFNTLPVLRIRCLLSGGVHCLLPHYLGQISNFIFNFSFFLPCPCLFLLFILTISLRLSINFLSCSSCSSSCFCISSSSSPLPGPPPLPPPLPPPPPS